MIRELSELGKKIRSQNNGQKLIHNALKEEPVTIDVVINEDGGFHSYNKFEKKLTTVEAITAKKGKARLLLDKAEEVLGYGGESSKKKHQLYLDKIDQYKELQELKPVLAFFGQNKMNGVDKALSEFEKAIPEKERKGNIAFRLLNRDKRIHEEPNVFQGIIEGYEKTQKTLLSQTRKKCSICGTDDYPVVDEPHGMIQVPGGRSGGSALVSYNGDHNPFESYGMIGNENSGICTNCAKTYVEGLKWLLLPERWVKKGKKEVPVYAHRKNFGADTAIVFWTRENRQINEVSLLDTPDSQEVSNLIDSIAKGSNRNAQYIETDQFYSCTLSGSAARISVREWIETSLVDFRKNIAKWFQDIAIDYFDFDSKKCQTHYSRFYDLARSCQNEKEDKEITFSRIAGHLWNCALKNNSPPIWILASVLKRTRLDERGVTPERAALIKLILNRNNKKGGMFMVAEKLDPENKDTAYVSGKIFAVLESIQKAALGKTNAGIRERFFTAASTNPASAFGRILKNAQNHLTKLKGEKPGLAVVLDKELQALVADIYQLPTIFSLEEQGQFAIGYYHQKNHQFNKPELKEITQEQED